MDAFGPLRRLADRVYITFQRSTPYVSTYHELKLSRSSERCLGYELNRAA